uniref:Uncharacterized protein n=1 Tax=Arundo donax TaxID=35708 RepID=A0A0A9GM02_ARUDO
MFCIELRGAQLTRRLVSGVICCWICLKFSQHVKVLSS